MDSEEFLKHPPVFGFRQVELPDCLVVQDHTNPAVIFAKRNILSAFKNITLLVSDCNFPRGFIMGSVVDPHYTDDCYRLFITDQIVELNYKNLRALFVSEEIPSEILMRLHTHFSDTL